MFNKVATFRMLAPRRTAPGVNAPANDNRRNPRPCLPQRIAAPRLVCRWELSASTGRPVCHWELDKTDEPGPRSREASLRDGPLHKTVFQPSYQVREAAGAASFDPGRVLGPDAPSSDGHGRPTARKVLHARHSTMRSSTSVGPAPSHRERLAIGLVANDLQLRELSCAGIHRAC
ncbi:MAG TPA: hypothetical protein VKY22_05045 [Bradyrhizobium sp.]|nr:hypothetical protein [Bradyrhizobium sp.]